MTDELNHHNDPTWLLHSARAASGNRPFLGDLEVIDAIVRQFVAGITERFERVSIGLQTPQDAAETDKAECVRLGGVFTGADQTYAPLPGWTDAGLAAYIRERMHETAATGETDSEVVAQAFASLVHSVYGMIGEVADLDEPTQEQMDKLNDHIRSLVWLLAGIESNE
jgi:hypothetical protein